MTTAVLEPVGETSPEDPEHLTTRPQRRYRLWLLGGFAIVTVIRILATQRAPFPAVIGDEVAYLSMAREISGRGGWNLGRAVLYSPGYSVLIAPFAALGWTSDTMYRAAEALNAVLGGLLFLALHAVIVRIGRIRVPWTIPVAMIGASLPALVQTTNYVWSDNLSPLIFVLACLAMLRMVEQPTLGRYIAAGAIGVGAYATHGRFAPVIAAMVLLAFALRLQQRIGTRDLILGTLATTAMFVAVYLSTKALYSRLYEPGGQDGYGASDLNGITQPEDFSLSVLGQLWYMVVSTAGLVAVGIMTMGRDVVEGLRARRDDQVPDDGSRAPLTVLVAITLLIGIEFAISAAYMTAAGRADTVIYGRYNDPLTCLLAALGLAALVRVGQLHRRAIDLALIVALAGIVPVLLRRAMPEVIDQTFFIGVTIAGVTAMTRDPIHRLGWIGGVGAVSAGLLVGASALSTLARNRRRAPMMPVLVLVVAASLASWGIVRGVDLIGTSASEDPRSITSALEFLEPGDVITYASPSVEFTNELKPFYVYPTVEPSVDFVRSFGPTSEITTPLVMAPADDPGLAANGYRIPWTDPHRNLALWVAPGPRQDALARQRHLLPPDWRSALPTGRNGVTDVDISIDGRRLEGSVVIERETGTPWAVVDQGGDSVGRVRVSIRVIGPDGATEDDLRADPQRDWVDADVSRLTVPIDLTADVEIGPDDRVEVRLIKEGVATFGNEVTVRP